MAAYAALVSLMNNMEQIHNHPHLSNSFRRKQIESLGKKLCFLLDFIERCGCSKEADDLESQIASAAQAAEDAIESHLVHQILAGKNNNSLLNLEQIIRGMEFIEEKVKQERVFNDQQPTYSIPTSSSRPHTMVGFDEYLTKLLEVLTRQQSGRQTISIIGMGGLGKTTLARNAYDNLLVAQHFDIRVWVTVSQAYNVKRILFEALSCLNGQSTSGVEENSLEQLGEKLYKILWGRRYLIILDDLWSIDVWEKMQIFFPDYVDGSKIMVTTRLSDLANSLGSWKLELNLLNNDKSWSLFCEMAFGEESCPVELQEIAKYLVNKCKGLPLSIVVIGGLLGKSSRSREYWESVARDANSILKSEKDEHCLNILSLSYSHLPAHLKPCFLYLGIFPEDHTIRVSRLIKLLVAEGFLKPNNYKSLEEVAEDYLEDLVDRNLLSVRRWRWNGKIKYCNIHDLLRELCLRIAEKEKFLHVMKGDDIKRGLEWERRIVFPEGTNRPPFKRRASLARSFILNGGSLPFRSSLLRVLTQVDSDSIDAILRQVNLRYLLYKPLKPNTLRGLPSSISLLWNVQTLIIRGDTERIYAPAEMWLMRGLRHVDCNEIYLPNPPPTGEVLQNLHTLANVVNLAFTDEVCKRIPNIKKLHIRYKEFSRESQTNFYRLYNLRFLHKLESLNCLFYKHPKRGCNLLQNLRFPTSLQKLSLTNSYLQWEDVTKIGLSLPRLQVLKLAEYSVIGSEWNVVKGAFPCLKFLRIQCEDLINWTAENSDFPVLEKLVLDSLVELDEIPLGMAYIPTLRYLRLYSCSVSAAVSSTKILEEQMNYGYEDLEVRVKFRDTKEEESFKENAEMLESYSSKNFQHTTSCDFLDLHLIAPKVRTFHS